MALFKLNYWKCVLVSLILAFALGSSGSFGGGSNVNTGSGKIDVDTIESSIDSAGEEVFEAISEALSSVPVVAWIGVVGLFIFIFLVAVAVGVFLLNPLALGCYKFYTDNHYAPGDLNKLGYGFTSNYLNNVKTLFFRDLFIWLWSLLFVIPGVIKSYAYRMVPYIMAENPNLSYKEVLAKSEEMMNGQKWNTFILDLSFIGWGILSLLTCGILSVFYVRPYKDSTNAELYFALKPVDYYTAGQNDAYAQSFSYDSTPMA